MPGIAGIIAPTSTQAADRRTFGDLIDELARPIDADDTTVRALAADAVRSAIRFYNRLGGWPWEIQTADITFTANVAGYTVPATFKLPLGAHYLTASGGLRDERLIYMPFGTFVEMASHNKTSPMPSIYTFRNILEEGQVIFWPIPSAVDYVQIHFYRNTPRPRNDNEPMEIPEDALEGYMARAWYEFLKRLPQNRRPFDINVARIDAKEAVTHMSAMVNMPTDTMRTSAFQR